jgi:asparagine synthase (glutamine-hydrolysing)
MCGIFGVLGFRPGDLAAARGALATLAHRGPDGEGEWSDDWAWLGHRRLAIRDLSEAGRQPFVSDDGEVVALVNGEIWNDRELRAELGPAGFAGRCDAEVVLHGYCAWGFERLLAKLDGMYALVVYDRRAGRAFLARDRFGVKPLFVAERAGRVLVASEAKALLAFDPALRVFSLAGVQAFVANRSTHHPRTLFRGVERLLPGAWAEVRRDAPSLRARRYYDLLDVCAGAEAPARLPGDAEVDAELEARLGAAVDRRLASDVPIGMLLSGGLDSSLVTWLATRREPGLPAFSAGLAEERFAHFSETAWSSHAAAVTGAKQHVLTLASADFATAFERCVWLMDGELDRPPTLGLQLLARFAKPHVSVLLTGEGSDELFGGYLRLRRALTLARGSRVGRLVPRRLFDLPWAARGPRARAGALYQAVAYAGRRDAILEDLGRTVSPDAFARLFGAPPPSALAAFDRERLRALPFARALLVVEHLTFLTVMLDRQDRSSMGAGVEVRTPFVDRALVEWAMRLPPEALYDAGANKKPVARIAARIFGADFAARTKLGFPVPFWTWLKDPALLGAHAARSRAKDFVLWERVDQRRWRRWLARRAFDGRTLAWEERDRRWLAWYGTVLRAAQDAFGISAIGD